MLLNSRKLREQQTDNVKLNFLENNENRQSDQGDYILFAFQDLFYGFVDIYRQIQAFYRSRNERDQQEKLQKVTGGATKTGETKTKSVTAGR